MCTDCSSSGSSYTVTTIYNQSCTECSSLDCSNSCVDAKCVTYKGAALPCSTIATGDSLELSLQKLDLRVCESVGNYLVYNYNCLATAGSISNEYEFVDLITSTVCSIQSDLSNFITSTFISYQNVVDNRFDVIEYPSKTCTSSGVVIGDSMSQILDKICTKFSNIDTSLNISSANWSSCYTVIPAPTTLIEGFNTVISQICQLKSDMSSAGVSLPTFNNVGSCLSTPTATDTLSDTVIKIRTRLCTTPTFDINTLSWGCVSKPSTVATDLQSAFQSVLSQVDDYIKNKLTFSGDFVVSQTNVSDACAGKTVSLSTSLSQDRLVAATTLDNSPGTLVDKLDAGSGVTLDSTTTPGKIIISTSGTADDKTVKASSSDNIPGFLDQKVEGLPGQYVNVATSYNPYTKKLEVAAGLNLSSVISDLFDLIETDSVLKQRFCEIVSSCPSPCEPPSNVQAIYVDQGTTTSTTSTSTSSTSTTSTTTIAPILDTIYYGINAVGSHPDATYVVTNGTTTLQNSANNVNINWTTFNASPEFCWVAIPNRVATSYKNKWYVDVLNNGDMGGVTDLFGAPIQVTISGVIYNVWITNYQTQFTATCQLRYS